MTRGLAQRGLWLVSVAAFMAALLWLDQNRGGPSSTLSRCNLLLSRSAEPAADVLLVGSSRTGAALDPIAMQDMLAHALPDGAPTVERMALGHNPLRASLALLQNYVETRGAPGVIALEIMFMTPRSVDRLAQRGLSTSPEQYIFRRDLNLMTYEQILGLPAVAMPYSEEESWINRLRFRLRGAVLRAGALTYQFLRRPQEHWELAACGEQDWTREPDWPADFAFSYGSFLPGAAPAAVIDELEGVMADSASGRGLKPWQSGVPTGQDYPYDFGASYRQGEVALLRSMMELAAQHQVPVLLLPLPLYGYEPAADDLRELRASLPGEVQVLDLYGQVRGDLGRFWYDDGHLEPYPAGALTTAILARHLLDARLLDASRLTASVSGGAP